MNSATEHDRTIQELIQRIDRLQRENEVLHYQRLVEEKKSAFFLRELLSIHALIYPPITKLDDGRVFQFESPMKVEQIQALSDAIRAIPGKLRDF